MSRVLQVGGIWLRLQGQELRAQADVNMRGRYGMRSCVRQRFVEDSKISIVQ